MKICKNRAEARMHFFKLYAAKYPDETGAEFLRYVVGHLDHQSETHNDKYTADELCTLMRACRLSDWDFYPDTWTKQQISDVLKHGVVPVFCVSCGGSAMHRKDDTYKFVCILDPAHVV